MNYPDLVKGYVYRLKIYNSYVCVSPVLKPKYPEYGCNINVVGAMGMKGGSHLCFLSEEDAQAFVKKYLNGATGYTAYKTKAFDDEYVRLDNNATPPAYVLKWFADGYKDKLNPEVTNRLNATPAANPFVSNDAAAAKAAAKADKSASDKERIVNALVAVGAKQININNKEYFSVPVKCKSKVDFVLPGINNGTHLGANFAFQLSKGTGDKWVFSLSGHFEYADYPVAKGDGWVYSNYIGDKYNWNNPFDPEGYFRPYYAGDINADYLALSYFNWQIKPFNLKANDEKLKEQFQAFFNHINELLDKCADEVAQMLGEAYIGI